MVRKVSVDRITQDILERICEHGMSYVDGDDLRLGKIRGLEEALKIIGWVMEPGDKEWSSLFNGY